MSFFILPAWVIKHIDRLRRSFFWKGTPSTHGSDCLMNWDRLCQPKDNGGLGVINISTFNRCLVAKWWWKLISSPNLIWAKIVIDSYFPPNTSLPLPRLSSLRSSPFWKGVLKTKEFFSRYLKIIVGDGSNVMFWQDIWINNTPLATVFPTLFEISSNPLASLASQRSNNRWVPTFGQHLSSQRLQELLRLHQLLRDYTISSNPDSVSWTLDTSGIFSVRSLYKELKTPNMSLPPGPNIWTYKTPLKVKITLWLAIHGRLLTSDMLLRRNIAPAFLCPFCLDEQENANHIFLRCSFVSSIWDHLRQPFQLPRPPDNLNSLLYSWRNRWVATCIAPRWDAIVAAAIWLIWYERNSRIFNGKTTESNALTLRIISISEFWRKNLSSSS